VDNHYKFINRQANNIQKFFQTIIEYIKSEEIESFETLSSSLKSTPGAASDSSTPLLIHAHGLVRRLTKSPYVLYGLTTPTGLSLHRFNDFIEFLHVLKNLFSSISGSHFSLLLPSSLSLQLTSGCSS
jgi:hypothetical protein